MVKARLEKISPTARKPKEKAAWDAIKKEEEREDRVAATTHVLLERADKWGRKAISATTLSVTGEVAKVANKQKGMMKLASDEGDKRKQQLRAKAKKDMQRIQDELARAEKAVDEDVDAAKGSIMTKFKPSFDAAETRLKDANTHVPQRVANFVEDIKDFTLDQLEMLAADRPVVLVHEGVEKTIAVPGTHKKERALAGEG
jgi:hypothetical protein